MFDEYSPEKGRMLQIIDNDGKVINKEFFPDISDNELVEGFKKMIFARTVDLRAVSYQRQGRMYTYPPNLGQEAIATAAGMVIRDEDWLVPAYRELSAWLQKGATIKDILLFFAGHEDGSRFPGAKNMFTVSVPIASQIPHAVGIAFATKFKKQDSVTFTFFGDGATSKGDFHEALNFAGVWKAPVIFICQNNQYAISLPREKQTASKSIAIKAVAYGIKGIQVDGNDLIATYNAIKESAEYAKAGNGPVLIEAYTYRMGAHTTSDDPKKYRSSDEEKEWKKKDPIDRMRKYLVSKNLWNEADEKPLIEKYQKEVDAQFLEVENYKEYALEEAFDFMYADKPDLLKKQQADYERFAAWKGAK